MPKPIKTFLKLQIEACKANPAPPVGPALGQHGINIQKFCEEFNAASKDMIGDIVPVEIIVYEDRSFDFRLKTPPASDLLRKAAGINKGASTTGREKVGRITKEDLRKISERKMVDLNAGTIEAAEKIIAGTAKSMGLEII